MTEKTFCSCIVYGSPFNDMGGYTIVGPFANYKAARDYANQASQRNEDDEWSEDFVIVDLHTHHPKDGGSVDET